MLNLTKGQTLDLTKADGTAVSKVRVGLAWDVAEGQTLDADLFVVRKSDKKVAYFNDRAAITGVFLSEDNLTGEGDGDDEYTIIDTPVSEDGTYIICMNIYDAVAKGQTLGMVTNCVATVYDDASNEVLAKFNVSEDGGTNTSMIIGEVEDTGDTGKFTAKGNFINGDINEVVASL